MILFETFFISAVLLDFLAGLDQCFSNLFSFDHSQTALYISLCRVDLSRISLWCNISSSKNSIDCQTITVITVSCCLTVVMVRHLCHQSACFVLAKLSCHVTCIGALTDFLKFFKKACPVHLHLLCLATLPIPVHLIYLNKAFMTCGSLLEIQAQTV